MIIASFGIVQVNLSLLLISAIIASRLKTHFADLINKMFFKETLTIQTLIDAL